MPRKKKEMKAEIQSVRKIFCVNLRRLRENGNLSQNMLGKAAGLTHNFINDMENGKKGASDKTIAKLCSALNVEPFQLFMPIDFHGDEFQCAVVKNFRDTMIKELDSIMEYYNLSEDNKT